MFYFSFTMCRWLGWEILRNQCQYTVYTACILGDAVYILSITNAYLIRWGGGKFGGDRREVYNIRTNSKM